MKTDLKLKKADLKTPPNSIQNIDLVMKVQLYNHLFYIICCSPLDLFIIFIVLDCFDTAKINL